MLVEVYASAALKGFLPSLSTIVFSKTLLSEWSLAVKRTGRPAVVTIRDHLPCVEPRET